ncbi:glycosyltransferase [Pseudactinotalea suaedae]|uniref:glycosyltransferase n=1 Tax=Pseudactinotalea suaedae TaxID=1524924 RepID=UPI001F5016E7|nr:glycosyltransferase family 2 protein [Pseudactinotalea suaedae]
MSATLPTGPLGWVLSIIVLLGAVPMLVSASGHVMAGLHRVRDNYGRADSAYQPRVAVIIPAWNEGAVLEHSIDRMMALDYPSERLRLVVVDDASTDDTPLIAQEAARRYPGRVVHLRREQGGQGKAHTLNHGLAHVLADDWAEAVLITDADVVFTPTAIGRMGRHLADPGVGAVMGFIREASEPAHWVGRYIGFEYATAQLAMRRAQNVAGVQGCLAGGAQMLSRANLEAIGGRIDTTTLAEDTVTTMQTQLGGRRVVFDPNAECWAEEPASLVALWKQRLRWARGNLQVTRRFRSVFFRPSSDHHLGNWWFGTMWFSTLYLPAFMILASVALVLLWFVDQGPALLAFELYWGLSALLFIFGNTFVLLLDRRVAYQSWLAALTFPGLVNLLVLAVVLAPRPMDALAGEVMPVLGITWDDRARAVAVLLAYVWTGAAMLAGWLVYRADRISWLRPVVPALVLVVGFGPVLCAVSIAAYVAEARGAASTWDKTEKTGKVRTS